MSSPAPGRSQDNTEPSNYITASNLINRSVEAHHSLPQRRVSMIPSIHYCPQRRPPADDTVKLPAALIRNIPISKRVASLGAGRRAEHTLIRRMDHVKFTYLKKRTMNEYRLISVSEISLCKCTASLNSSRFTTFFKQNPDYQWMFMKHI